MSNGFNFTQLESEEKIVFGPVTQTKSTSVGGSSGQQVTHTSGRTVGITNQRVIVEQLNKPDSTRIINNTEIQQVRIKRQNKQGNDMIALVSVGTKSGENIKLDIKWLPALEESKLSQTFPNAEVEESKGGLSKVVLIIIGAGIFVVCILPFIIMLIAKAVGS